MDGHGVYEMVKTDYYDEQLNNVDGKDDRLPQEYAETFPQMQVGIHLKPGYQTPLFGQGIVTCCDISNNASDREKLTCLLRQKWTGETVEDLAVFRNELHYLAKLRHQPIKLRVMCRFLKDKRIHLHDERLRGELYQETVLCTAIISDNAVAVRTLLDGDLNDEVVQLIQTQYSTIVPEYTGATAIHLAIAKNKLDCLQAIVEPVNDAEVLKKLLAMEVKGPYFHQTFVAKFPVAMALNLFNMSMVEYLIQHGAAVDQQDADYCYSIIHSLVAVGDFQKCQISMSTFKTHLGLLLDSSVVLKWWVRKATYNPVGQARVLLRRYLLQLANSKGENALQYASRIGCQPAVEALLEVENVYKYPQWKCGPSQRVLYDVTEVVPKFTGHDRPSNCVLEILTYDVDRYNFGGRLLNLWKCSEGASSSHERAPIRGRVAWCNVPVLKCVLQHRWEKMSPLSLLTLYSMHSSCPS